MMEDNNEKKRFGRRAGFGITALALSTISYYVCLFKNVPLEWFNTYSAFVVGIIGFIIGGLTITDILLKKK